MARPARYNAEYFTHNADFRNDRRVKAIRSNFGAAGYGIVLMLLEILTDADHTQLCTDDLELELLSGDLGVSVTEIHSLLQLAEKIGLFSRNEGGFLICPDLNKSLEPVFEKRNRARNAAQNKDSQVPDTDTGVSVTETTQSKVKESKGKKSSKSNSSADADASAGDSEKEYTLTHQIRLVIQQHVKGYAWSAKDATHAQKLADKLKSTFEAVFNREATDKDVLNSLKQLLAKSKDLQPFYHFQDVPKLNERYNATLNLIRNPTDPKNGKHLDTFKATGPVGREIT